MEPQAITALARQVGLGEIADELAALARPSLRLLYDGTPAVGASKLGGLPDVPAGMPWPTVERFNDPRHPMVFVGQIDLGGLDPWLWPRPPGGLLSFFCGPEIDDGVQFDEWGPARVFHIPAGVELHAHEQPRGLGEEFILGEVAVTPAVEMTLPGNGVGAAAALDGLGFGWRGPREHQSRSYNQLLDRIDEMQQAAPRWTPLHRMLGWADLVQDDCLTSLVSAAEPQLTMAELHARALDWRLLLQVDSDDNGALAYMFDDGGRLYFGLPADDLAAGRFDRVQAIVDSG